MPGLANTGQCAPFATPPTPTPVDGGTLSHHKHMKLVAPSKDLACGVHSVAITKQVNECTYQGKFGIYPIYWKKKQSFLRCNFDLEKMGSLYATGNST